MVIMITGSTGYLGKNLVNYFIEEGHMIHGYARRWEPHESLQSIHGEHMYQYTDGDICSYEDLSQAVDECIPDLIIHAAAMKSVPSAEKNPSECIRVNIDGTKNVVRVAKERNIHVFHISTDKAVSPINLYGYTKAVAEKIVSSYHHGKNLRFGNVLGSTGSILTILEKVRYGELSEFKIFGDGESTRFYWSVNDAVNFVSTVINGVLEGHHSVFSVFIPKMKSFSIVDVVHSYLKVTNSDFTCSYSVERIGDKKHEQLNNPYEDIAWRDNVGCVFPSSEKFENIVTSETSVSFHNEIEGMIKHELQ